ncbi:MAG: phosphoenolpyruvate synthase [Candidatus Hadarchaeia archaeon]
MKNVVWFEELSSDDVEVAGGKGASLGEMIGAGLPVPPGFAVTAQAYGKFVEEEGIIEEINELLAKVDVDDSDELHETGEKIRNMIMEAKMPEDIKDDIVEAYKELSERSGGEVSVAVRSSATAEDMPDASFAGQQETYLHISGDEDLLHYVQKCWASLFTDRAIFYREKNDYAHDDVLISVPVQKMVNSEKAGVMFTSHPSTGDKSQLVIEANWGLGETVVSGSVTPDTYVVDKETGEILQTTIGSKEEMIVRDPDKGKTMDKSTPQEKREAQVIDEEEAKILAELGRKLEDHYGRPQDSEWAVEDGEIYLVQSRPITVLYGDEEEEEKAEEEEPSEVIIRGLGASPGRASGKVKVIPSADDIRKVKDGDILVAEMTAPDWVPAMRRAAAIVTDEGGTTCHAAIVSRELGTPSVVGTGNATEVLKNEMEVTVDGSSGSVYKGLEKVEEEEEKAAAAPTQAVSSIPPTATDVKVNISLPDIAEDVAEDTQADGVGLLRAEHMLLNIGKHPKKILEEDGEEKMIEQFSAGVRTVAEAFSPKSVWYRTLDLKTAEFKNLEGGEDEPDEPNPMIGWRGVRRFVDPDNPEEQEVLKAELKALKKVVDEGYSNLGVMLPMSQHPEELKRFKRVAREVGLEPHEDFQIGIMVEIPAAALIIEEFIKEGIDFVSFGTNDLTQFTLAVDRDNERIADLYDERHPAVQSLIKRVIKKCNESGVETSICGQAGSYPDVVEKLVKYGISSVSANPDAVHDVRRMVSRTERGLILSHAREDLEDSE